MMPIQTGYPGRKRATDDRRPPRDDVLTDDELAAWLPPRFRFRDRTGTLTAVQVCRAVGITYRQLHYWIACGYIAPAIATYGSGTVRGFTADNVRDLRVLARLAAATTRRIADCAHAVRLWRDADRPYPATVGLHNGIPKVWTTDDDLLADLRTGLAVVVTTAEPPMTRLDADSHVSHTDESGLRR